LPQHVLLVEDDATLGRQIVGHLEKAGYPTKWIKDGDHALREPPESYALVVLDLMLPGAYGLDVLKRIRQIGSAVPILVLSARNDTRDKVRAFELGADDYVGKPFWPEELLARIRARLRRPVMEHDGVLDLDGLTVDLKGHRVLADGSPLSLTRLEFDLLAEMAHHPNAVLRRGWLADRVLSADVDDGGRSLDVYISRLRRKLGRFGSRVATVWGVGYRLEANDHP
jgi:DNA-binding response OmpR family regulator